MLKRIKVVVLGLIFALLLMEASLRIIGYVYTQVSSGRKVFVSPGRKDRAIKILCLGNSLTSGGPTPEDNYPVHLEKMLNSYYQGMNFIVINEGHANANSSEILSKLPAYIDKYAPDYAILTTGTPNLWNRYKYSDYLKRKSGKYSLFLWGDVYNTLFHEFRVFRLAGMILGDFLKNNTRKEAHEKDEQVEYKVPAHYDEVVQWTKNMWRVLFPEKTEPVSIDQKQADNAVKTLEDAVALAPENVTNYSLLGEIFMMQKDYPRAAQWYIRGIEADPYFRKDEENRCYCFLRWINENVHDAKVQGIISDYIKRCNIESNAHIFYNLKELKKKEIYDWIVDDVNEMLDIMEKAHVKAILHNYPPRDGSTARHTRMVNLILRNIAHERKIMFIDHEHLFREIWSKGDDRKRYHLVFYDTFIDFHLNREGYRRMAYYIFEAIRNSGFMEFEKSKIKE
ncbi:MAG: hypothetical protein PHF69_06295 [Candidatus Omnitrophica bacterium]|nr:hypothetical protein [Candidatus Omnitrophota bacterium]